MCQFLQERIIERLKEQRDREEREKVEEMESSKRELKELKEKVSLLQGDLSDREVSITNDLFGLIGAVCFCFIL